MKRLIILLIAVIILTAGCTVREVPGNTTPQPTTVVTTPVQVTPGPTPQVTLCPTPEPARTVLVYITVTPEPTTIPPTVNLSANTT